jgi:hypothetical protein
MTIGRLYPIRRACSLQSVYRRWCRQGKRDNGRIHWPLTGILPMACATAKIGHVRIRRSPVLVNNQITVSQCKAKGCFLDHVSQGAKCPSNVSIFVIVDTGFQEFGRHYDAVDFRRHKADFVRCG